MDRIKYLFILIGILVFGLLLLFKGMSGQTTTQQSKTKNEEMQIISGSFDTSKFKTEAEWEKILDPQQFYILRKAGTEAPFTGKLNKENRKGTYYSAGCDQPIFRSEEKYDSGTGWPSFWAPISDDALVLRSEPPPDDRIEVLDKCGGHLGHVFDDGPKPSGKRYCMNSGALYFVPDK